MYLTTSVKFGIKGKLRLSADRFGIMPRLGGFRGKKTSCRLNDFIEASHFTENSTGAGEIWSIKQGWSASFSARR